MWLGLEKLVRGMFKRLQRCTSNRRYEPCGKKAVCYSTLHFTTFFSWGGSNEAKKKIFRTACSIPCCYHPPLQRRGLFALLKEVAHAHQKKIFFNTRPPKKKSFVNSKRTKKCKEKFRPFMLLMLDFRCSRWKGSVGWDLFSMILSHPSQTWGHCQ